MCNSCTILHFVFLPDKPAKLPVFLGSALRGVMGRQLLKNDQSRVYVELFSRIDEDTNDTPPNPYVIYHAGLSPRMPDEPLRFDVKLYGAAARFQEDVILALKEGCAAGLGAQRHVFNFDNVTKESVPIFTADRITAGYERITLVFDTPVQIRKYGVGVMWTLDFELLIRNIIRRLHMLGVICKDSGREEALEQQARKVNIVHSSLTPYYMRRWSNRTESHKSLGGLIGQICFEGEITEFIPYLNAGSLVHVGKACTMGLGHFSLAGGSVRPDTNKRR